LSEQLDFDDFYRACREEIVRALVLTVGHRDLGLEAADEAFARALERWADVSGYENPEGWVYRVGANWARSKLRRRTFILDGLFGNSVYIDDLPEPELLTAVEHLPGASHRPQTNASDYATPCSQTNLSALPSPLR
jgi:predicted RNA polymerase sigma factor